MDEKQIDTLKFFGYQITELPGKPIPHMDMWTPDGRKMIHLPADPYHLRRYLNRGFLLEPPKVTEQGSNTQETGSVAVMEERPKRRYRSHKKEK